MDFTMLRQASRRARLQAMLEDGASDLNSVSQLSAILSDTNLDADALYANTGLPFERPLSPEQLSDFLAVGALLDDTHYLPILDYVRIHWQPYQSYKQLPAQPGIPVLPPNAKQLRTFTVDGCTFSDQLQHEGNSAIQFRKQGADRTGFIQYIWVLPLEQQLHTFILVRPHSPLPDHEFRHTPYAHYTLLRTQIYDAAPSPSLLVLEPKDIVAHVTTLRRPAGTYRIPHPTLVVCSALNRERK